MTVGAIRKADEASKTYSGPIIAGFKENGKSKYMVYRESLLSKRSVTCAIQAPARTSRLVENEAIMQSFV